LSTQPDEKEEHFEPRDILGMLPLIIILAAPPITLYFLMELNIGIQPKTVISPNATLTQLTQQQTFETIVFFLFLLTVLGFLYAMKWLMFKKDYDEALGLPQGSIRTVIALSVIFFALFVGIFKLSVPAEIITLLTALVSFYFGAATAKPKTGGGGEGANGETQKTVFDTFMEKINANSNLSDDTKKQIKQLMDELNKKAKAGPLTKADKDDAIKRIAKIQDSLIPDLTELLFPNQ